MASPLHHVPEIGAICLHDVDVPIPRPVFIKGSASAYPGTSEGYPFSIGRPEGKDIVFLVIGQPGHVPAINIHHVDIHTPVGQVEGRTDLLWLLPVADKGYALAIGRPSATHFQGRMIRNIAQACSIGIDKVDILVTFSGTTTLLS